MTIDDEEMQRRRKVVQKEHPIHISNVALIDPESGKPTKVATGYLDDGTKVRFAKKSGAVITKPNRDDCKFVNRTKSKEAGDYDTATEDVLEKTYLGEDFVSVFNEFNEYIRLKEDKEKLLVFKN